MAARTALAINTAFLVFLFVLVLVEGTVLLWALRFPVRGCTDEIIDGCFPDWRSYFTVGLLVSALGMMAMGSPPDLTMLAGLPLSFSVSLSLCLSFSV